MAPIWQKIIDAPGGFAVCGVYVADKLHLGTYGTGNIYSFLPLVTELENSGEAVLSMCAFKGQVYATSENNDMESQKTRVLRRTGMGWVEAGKISGYATFFMTVWGDYLIVTATTDLKSIDYWYSKDGSNFIHGAHLNDWLWVPVEYNREYYLIGHSGPGFGPGSAMGVKWTGDKFETVPALCRGDVMEWQCADEHNGALYLGGGGWTLGRGTSQATVYRFDGNTCSPVKNDPGYHEVQCVFSSKIYGYLYASFGQGFKTDTEGGSQLWASLDGINWIDAGHFDCPQLYSLMDSPYGFIVAGGRQGNLSAYFFDARPSAPPPTPLPLEHKCPKCGHSW